MSNETIIIKDLIKSLESERAILSADELVVIRRLIYNLDNMHVFDKNEIDILRKMMVEFTGNSDFREIMDFMITEFGKEDDRTNLKSILKANKVVSSIAAFFSWLRNIIIVAGPIIVVWLAFSDKINGILRTAVGG